MEQIVECVPNFSEGRDRDKIERIVESFRGREGVKLLDYSADRDHNRMVVTAIGAPEPLRDAVVEAVGVAVGLIDLGAHTGTHPRIGAADVVPFIPLRGITIEQAAELAREAGRAIAAAYGVPVYLYERSAGAPHRENLADIRRGGFEGLAAKMRDPLWVPDFGPRHPHATAGAVVVGARMPLIAFNIDLDTGDVEPARRIARKIRQSSGGLPCCKALGMRLDGRDRAQVSVNLTDYTRTSLWDVCRAVEAEATALGVGVAGSELIGLIPLGAVADVAARALCIADFSTDRILETHLWE